MFSRNQTVESTDALKIRFLGGSWQYFPSWYKVNWKIMIGIDELKHNERKETILILDNVKNGLR